MKINGKRVKVEYQEVYSEGAMVITNPLKLPDLKHLTRGFHVVLCELLKAGTLEDGREFQEIRVVLEADPIHNAETSTKEHP